MEVGFEVTFPDDLAGAGVQAEQVSFCAQGIDLPMVNDRRCARTGGVTNGVGTIIFVLPHDLPVRFVQAEYLFDSPSRTAFKLVGRVLYARCKQSIGDVDPSVGNRRTAITTANGSAPALARSAGGKLL